MVSQKGGAGTHTYISRGAVPGLAQRCYVIAALCCVASCNYVTKLPASIPSHPIPLNTTQLNSAAAQFCSILCERALLPVVKLKVCRGGADGNPVRPTYLPTLGT